MSNSFKFLREKTAAGHTGAKEKVSAKKSKGYELWNIHNVNKTDPLFSEALARTFATGSSQNRGKPVAGGFIRLVLHVHAEGSLHWWQGCSGQDPPGPVVVAGMPWGVLGRVLGCCWYSGWRRWKVALISLWHSLPEAVTICQKAVQQPQGFYFLCLLCYCNAVHIWANFLCRMSTSALC